MRHGKHSVLCLLRFFLEEAQRRLGKRDVKQQGLCIPFPPSPLPKYRNLDGPDVKHYDKESKPSGGLGGERRGGHGGKEGGRTGHQRVETLPPPFFLLLPLSPTLLSCPSTSFLPPATPSWETHRAPRDKASLTPASGCRISASMGRPGRGG